MKIVGVIAEYNPFHRGHAYHLSKARELSRADFTVVAMSGNYVQRGVPAMFDKYTRAEAALRNGADLVLELPLCAAAGSAEYFASGAVSLLLASGIVTDLCFGSECGEPDFLKRTADILAAEPPEYQRFLKQALKSGHPFPKARAMALHQYDVSIPLSLLEEPNDLLGMEYLKALKRLNSSVQVHILRRRGAHYHEQQMDPSESASASGIRRALCKSGGALTPEIAAQLPSPEVYAAYAGRTPITEDAFSLLLLEKLRRLEGQPLDRYFDVSKELSNRIWNCLDDFSSFSQFTDLVKTRNLTRTAVSRALLHILLDIYSYRPPEALRVLGFRREAAGLLKLMSENGSLPVVTGLPGEDVSQAELYPDRLYESVRSLLHGQPYRNEYRRKMLVIG